MMQLSSTSCNRALKSENRFKAIPFLSTTTGCS